MNWVGGLGLGAGFMYLMDPDRGRRRRALARDQVLRQLHRAGNGMEVAARDIAHRSQGVAARTRGRLLHRTVDDDVLVARVRSKLGRLVSHPHAIEVNSDHQNVTLRGLVLAHEAEGLMTGLMGVSGVRKIENQVKAYEHDEHIPSLQGGKSRQGNRLDFLQNNWSPATRMVTGSASMLPIIAGFRRKDPQGYVMSGLGLGLLIRALSNETIQQFLGFGPSGMITVHKSIQIDALPEDVFNFWSDFDNFPQFLPEVLEVRALGQNRSHWKVVGPAGLPVQWKAITTRYEPGKMIAWRSEPGSIVRNTGRICFIPEADGGTRIEMDLSYRPPGGRLGHAVARLFGTDPKSQSDDALVRVKGLLERGFSSDFGRMAVGS
jgi:uncharacterized membrane protein